jgi:hypothetical protein
MKPMNTMKVWSNTFGRCWSKLTPYKRPYMMYIFYY